MNELRRQKLKKIIDEIVALRESIADLIEEEQRFIDNMPENLQESEKVATFQQAVGSLSECEGYLENAEDVLSEI